MVAASPRSALSRQPDPLTLPRVRARQRRGLRSPSLVSRVSLVATFPLLLSALACGPDDPAAETESSTATTSSSSGSTSNTDASSTGTGADTDPIEPARCTAPPGMGSPTTIVEALELLNALPEPITIPCVLQSLDRPLAIKATSSTFSTQPAADNLTPRIFIFSGPLILSVVPGGTGRDLLEFGEPRGDGESLKGELLMPVELPIPAGKPYDHLRYTENITVCGVCHRDEHLAVELDHPNAFISRALRPDDDHIVELDELRLEHDTCDPALDPERCEMLSAIFSHGPVVEEEFPEGLATIFDR